MKALKGFDLFQKISVDDIKQTTLVGSLLSITAILMIAYLFLKEVYDYFTPQIRTETVVYHDPDQDSKIKVNFGIGFPNMPCHIISVDQQDQVGNHRMDIGESLKKFKLIDKSFKGEYTPSTFVDPQIITEAINKKEGCSISGHVEISKVPGNIHISHHNYPHMYEYLRDEKKELFDVISFNHRLNILFFGDIELSYYQIQKFGFSDFTLFSKTENLPDFSGRDHSSYDYYIKLIPHRFVDEINGDEFNAYQYSITAKPKDYDPDEEMPTVTFNYDLAPVTMKITRSRKSFTHALTHICAIVGGVYVMFSLLNKFALIFCDCYGEENKVGPK